MKFGEVPRRPETRRATVDGLCESLKEFRRGERVAASPLPGRRAAGCSGEPPPGRGAVGCLGTRRAEGFRAASECYSLSSTYDSGSSIVNELSLAMCQISRYEILRVRTCHPPYWTCGGTRVALIPAMVGLPLASARPHCAP